jgi:predicted glycosyltransferase
MFPKRLLIYSHDSFGLGHLRRCRSIALSLVARHPKLSVMIISGLPLIARFGFHPQIHITLVPGIIKTDAGEYRALSTEHDIHDAIEQRSRIILETAQSFRPDLLLVDKEPLGVRGEVQAALDWAKQQGVPMVLGLRDVMDEPGLLAREWARKNAVAAIEDYYDEIWIYGLPQIFDPLAGIELTPAARRRIVFTSYLRRSDDDGAPEEALAEPVEAPFLLVTPGGGGDGERLVDWVLKALEHDPEIPHRILIVSGPFMNAERRAHFQARTARLAQVSMVDFVPGMERLMASASGVVAMGGYNTFCEILSFDKPALIVPRTIPRLEQFIRAARAQELGLASMLVDDLDGAAQPMADALRKLPWLKRPSSVSIPGLLAGHETIARRADFWLNHMVETDASLDAHAGDRRLGMRGRE